MLEISWYHMHLVHLNDAPSLLTEGPLNKWQVAPPQQLWIMQFNLKNWASLLSSAQLSAVLDFVWLWLQNQVHCYPEVSLGEDSGKNMYRVPIHRMKDRNFQMGHNFRLTEVSFPRDENEMQLNTGWVFVRALPFILCTALSCYHEPSTHFLKAHDGIKIYCMYDMCISSIYRSRDFNSTNSHHFHLQTIDQPVHHIHHSAWDLCYTAWCSLWTLAPPNSSNTQTSKQLNNQLCPCEVMAWCEFHAPPSPACVNPQQNGKIIPRICKSTAKWQDWYN